MKYWRLYDSTEKEVGFYPQIVNPVFEGYYTDANQLWNIYSKPIDNTTVIPKGHLQKRAKLTDLMSVGFASGNFFVSDKLRKILDLFPKEGIQFADTEIITKTGEPVKANIMHPYINDYSFIDMNNSEFQISNVMGSIIYELMKFDSFIHFKNKKDEVIKENKRYEDISFHKSISISKLQFAEESDFGICSVFDVLNGGIGFYVSQRLKDKILEEKCTGIIFREINERYP